MDCVWHYETGILWSGSLVLRPDDPMPTCDDLPRYLEDLARQRTAEWRGSAAEFRRSKGAAQAAAAGVA